MPMHQIVPPEGYRESHKVINTKYSFKTPQKQTRTGSAVVTNKVSKAAKRNVKQVSEVGDQNSKVQGANVEEKMQKTTAIDVITQA